MKYATNWLLFHVKLLCKSWRMLWVVVLDKLVSNWMKCFNHWQQDLLQDVDMCHRIHAAFKFTISRSTLLTYGCPHVNLSWILWCWLAVVSTMVLHLHSCLIWVDAIWNVISNILSYPCQSLLFVCITDHLTVGNTTVCPSRLSSTCQCSSFTYMMAMLWQHFLQLFCCDFIIIYYFLIYQSSYFSSYLCLLPCTFLSTNGTTLFILLKKQ